MAVAVNNWYRPFYDAIQNALSDESTTTASDLYGYMFSFLILALTYVLIAVFTSFFVSHYVFRWRTAMNDYYTEKWKQVRHIEGASQRIQEDTMRFASIMKSLGVSIVDSVMTLIAFLPVLLELSKNVIVALHSRKSIISHFQNGLFLRNITPGGNVTNLHRGCIRYNMPNLQSNIPYITQISNT